MDDTSHAPVMKECSHCHHWVLLTHANWPKSSRENPSMSCCRKCRAVKGLPVEEGDSDEDDINENIDQLKLSPKMEPNAMTDTAAKLPEKKYDKTTSEGVMASRWAFVAEEKKENGTPGDRRMVKKAAASREKAKPAMTSSEASAYFTGRDRGDNGWGDRPKKPLQVNRSVQNVGLSRDIPPHMPAARDPGREKRGHSLNDQNAKLLESIARMEQRNRNMEYRPAFKTTLPSYIVEYIPSSD